MGDYKKTSTGAMANVKRSEDIEKDREKAQKEYSDYVERALKGEDVKHPGTAYKAEGGMVGRPSGKGFGKARARASSDSVSKDTNTILRYKKGGKVK